jgi:hypothetical protein
MDQPQNQESSLQEKGKLEKLRALLETAPPLPEDWLERPSNIEIPMRDLFASFSEE